jgi:DNA-binding transcriptional LysR family regulator
MNITLEEARTLDAVVRFGSFTKAAQNLHKSHSAVIYSLRSLENQTGLKLLDRSKYRTSLTPIGKRVWEQCKKLLASEQDFAHLCRELGSGWEPYLKIVVDGLIPFESILHALEVLNQKQIPTKIQVFEEFLGGVEDTFLETDADMMISVIAPQKTTLEPIRLCPISSYLVAHKEHPLVKTRKKATSAQLQMYPFLTVRGSDGRLNLPTSAFEEASAFHLSNFQSKKAAILKGLGYGWLPEYMIHRELASKTLKPIRWQKSNVHTYFPHVYSHGTRGLGRAGAAFLNSFLSFQHVPRCEECSTSAMNCSNRPMRLTVCSPQKSI